MKRCSRCKLLKDETEFTKLKRKKSGLQCYCRACAKIENKKTANWRKEYVLLNRDRLKQWSKDYSEKNRAALRQKSKQDRLNNPSYYKEYGKKYRDKHKEYFIEYNKRRRDKNKDQANAYRREYAEKNKELIAAKMKVYQNVNKKVLREKANERRRKRMKDDITFKLLHNLRRRLLLVVKGHRKADTTKKLIGCDLEYLKQHLENKFDMGMNWDNHGSYWEIDHIIPCKKWDLSKAEDQKKCFHYSNLQPLTAANNRSKSDKIL